MIDALLILTGLAIAALLVAGLRRDAYRRGHRDGFREGEKFR